MFTFPSRLPTTVACRQVGECVSTLHLPPITTLPTQPPFSHPTLPSHTPPLVPQVGEYISVSSQRDAEKADIEKERQEQLKGPAAQVSLGVEGCVQRAVGTLCARR